MSEINGCVVLSADEVGDRYGIGTEAVKELARARKLPCIRAGVRYVFPLAALESYEIELGKRCAEIAAAEK